jgi:hypothetical protein
VAEEIDRRHGPSIRPTEDAEDAEKERQTTQINNKEKTKQKQQNGFLICVLSGSSAVSVGLWLNCWTGAQCLITGRNAGHSFERAFTTVAESTTSAIAAIMSSTIVARMKTVSRFE